MFPGCAESSKVSSSIASAVKEPDGFPTKTFHDLHRDVGRNLPAARKLVAEGNRDLWSPIVN